MARTTQNGLLVLYLPLLLYVSMGLLAQVSATAFHPDPLVERQAASEPLVDFQVYEPVLVPSGAPCTQLLMEHVFAYSYGQPFVGTNKYRQLNEASAINDI